MMSPSSRSLTAVPVFPLPGFFLFPGTAAPLHIFEPRYRQMVNDLMDGPGRLVTVPYTPDETTDAYGPHLPDIGTLAEIVHHEKLDDGRYLILLLALERVAVQEVDSERLYRTVTAEILPEPRDDSPAAGLARLELLDALRRRTTGPKDLPEDTPLVRLADILLHALPLNPELLKQAYFERDPLVRASLALAWEQIESADEGEPERE
jgi:Lon protease-like protein